MINWDEKAKEIVRYVRASIIDNTEAAELLAQTLKLAESQGIGIGLDRAQDAICGKREKVTA